MNNLTLSRDADALICVLYKAYLQSRKSGQSKSDARTLGSAADIQATLMPKWSLEDVEDTLWGLDRLGLIDTFSADSTVYCAFLTDDGIVYMENRFRTGLDSLLDYLGKIKALMP